jgi:hypothetical protein
MGNFLRDVVLLCKKYNLSFKIEHDIFKNYNPRIKIDVPAYKPRIGSLRQGIEIGGSFDTECCPVELDAMFKRIKKTVEAHFE